MSIIVLTFYLICSEVLIYFNVTLNSVELYLV